MTKKLAIVLIGIFSISALTAFALLNKTQPTSQIFSNLLTTEKNDTVTIIGVGDMMLGTNYPSTAYLPPNDGKDLLTPVINVLKNADVTFGNLEGTLLDKGGYVKNCNDPSKCYAFRMPERYAKYLTEAGFDVVSIANNHVRDFGQPGLKKTIETLQNEGIHFAGLQTHPSTVFEINGMKYGFCAFAPNTGTVKIHDYEGAIKIVKELEAQSDIVIVSFHGGAEGSKHRHVTKKTEYYYGENRGNVYEFSHKLIDAGADVIFGHGPHITLSLIHI